MRETATERLRKLLDEQGVEYETNDNMGASETVWLGHSAYQLTPSAKLIMHPTPEDAIKATLGGRLTAEQVRECTEDIYLEGYNDGSVGRGAHLEETDWQSVADKLNSVRSCETCRNVHEPPKGCTFWPTPRFKCSECGATHVSMEYVYYCPNCGRKVVD